MIADATDERGGRATGLSDWASTIITKGIARKLTPNGIGTAGQTKVAEETEVRHQKRRDRNTLRSTYQQSDW